MPNMRTRREIFAGLGVLALAPMLGVAQEEREAIMPESIKKFLESLSNQEFVEVWTYFDSNTFAMTQMTDVLVAAHPDAGSEPQ